MLPPFGRVRPDREGELSDLWRQSGLENVREQAIDIAMRFESFADYWEPFLLRQGPAGAYVHRLDPRKRRCCGVRSNANSHCHRRIRNSPSPRACGPCAGSFQRVAGATSRVRFDTASEDQLRLNPHAADAAVGEIAVQKFTLRRVKDVPGRHVHVLRMIEGVQCFPAKLQTPVLADRH
jgi:hypothetical protein